MLKNESRCHGPRCHSVGGRRGNVARYTRGPLANHTTSAAGRVRRPIRSTEGHGRSAKDHNELSIHPYRVKDLIVIAFNRKNQGSVANVQEWLRAFPSRYTFQLYSYVDEDNTLNDIENMFGKTTNVRLKGKPRRILWLQARILGRCYAAPT